MPVETLYKRKDIGNRDSTRPVATFNKKEYMLLPSSTLNAKRKRSENMMLKENRLSEIVSQLVRVEITTVLKTVHLR